MSGQAKNSKRRTEGHFYKSIITNIWQTDFDINQIEFDFHKTWRGISVKNQDKVLTGTLCEWYYMFPEEAAIFVRLYLKDCNIKARELNIEEIKNYGKTLKYQNINNTTLTPS